MILPPRYSFLNFTRINKYSFSCCRFAIAFAIKFAEAMRCRQRAGCVPIRPLLNEGSCLMYDYRVLHRGTANRSAETRRMLYLLYTKPWFTDTINFGTCSIFAPDEEVISSLKETSEEACAGFCSFDSMS